MQHGFDTIAETYDARFTRSRIGSAQRELVWSYLRTILPDHSRMNILELACGTGEDALWFARRGHRVTATDASQGMLDVAAKKLAAEEFRPAVELRRLPAEDILPARTGAPYDLVFSNFGGLNCLSPSSLTRLAPDLRSLLKPGGRLVVVVMPRCCAWETLYFLLKGDPSSAFRRSSSGGMTAHLGDGEVTTWYHSPGSLAALLGSAFRLTVRRPVGFFIPPSYLEPFIATKPRLLRALASMDRAVSGWPFLASASDHALLDLEVRP